MTWYLFHSFAEFYPDARRIKFMGLVNLMNVTNACRYRINSRVTDA